MYGNPFQKNKKIFFKNGIRTGINFVQTSCMITGSKLLNPRVVREDDAPDAVLLTRRLQQLGVWWNVRIQVCPAKPRRTTRTPSTSRMTPRRAHPSVAAVGLHPSLHPAPRPPVDPTRRRRAPAHAPAPDTHTPPQAPPNEDDTELLLCLLAEVEEQISESRACVHGASNKLEESKEFEAASAERQKEAQLSEATRRKLQRRAQIIHAEVKSELAKATNSQKSST